MQKEIGMKKYGTKPEDEIVFEDINPKGKIDKDQKFLIGVCIGALFFCLYFFFKYNNTSYEKDSYEVKMFVSLAVFLVSGFIAYCRTH